MQIFPDSFRILDAYMTEAGLSVMKASNILNISSPVALPGISLQNRKFSNLSFQWITKQKTVPHWRCQLIVPAE